jgi:hypothetical protein
MIIEQLVEQERMTEEFRKRAYEQETREEMEAKQRVKEDLMNALVDDQIDAVIKTHHCDLASFRG